jgi:hypothetical protein
MKETENTNRKKRAGVVKRVASGDALNALWVKQRRFFLLLFVLAIAYITQHYGVERTAYAAKKMEVELERVHMGYVIRSSELMRFSKYSTVEQELKRRNINLIAPQHPPKQIKKD